MADTKRPKLSLPARTDGAPGSERRSRPPLRGADKPRPPRPASERTREEGGDRPAREGRSFGDKPRGAPRDGERGGFRDRPARDSARSGPPRERDERRPQGERAPRREDDRPRFSERPVRAPRSEGERTGRPPAFEGRDDNRRPTGERNDRPRREFGERPDRNDPRRDQRSDRPARPSFRDGDRPAARNTEERRPYGERPAFKRDEERSHPGERSERAPQREGRSSVDSKRPRDERPARPAFRDGDKPAPRNTEERRPFGERPARNNERPGFRDGDNRPQQSRGPGERPRRDDAPRTYGERPQRDVERDGPAPTRNTDDAVPAAPRGTSFGRARVAPRAEAEQERPRRPAPPERFANAPATVPEDAPGAMRLSKRMSELGLCSRREADDYIERGWVKVDGEVVAELGAKVLPSQRIELDMIAEEMQMRRVTILINKPIGYVSGQAEDGYEPAAVLITPENHWSEDPTRRRFESRIVRKLAPAGRLDIDSTGLLVLTQDGRIAKQLIGEYSDVEKEYLVRVEGDLSAEGMRLLHHGLTLDGVELLPAKVSWQNEDQLRFVLQEGRKRQIRRMCELVGLKVVGLKRIRIGRIPLGKLPLGQWRYLGEHEKF